MAEIPKPRIAYQGAVGAFSHLASQRFASDYLGNFETELIPCSNFEEAFKQASNGNNTLACIPFENSTVGSIIENYQLLFSSNLFVHSELTLPIHHQLLALPGTHIEDIIDVYSHPVALDQCKKIFREHAKMHPQVYFDTGAAARLIKTSKRKDAAAIAAIQAAKEYDLEVIAANVEDYSQNCTRFKLIGKMTRSKSEELQAPFKFVAGFEGAGDLNEIAKFAPFLDEEFRLLKVEALPIAERPWHFRLVFEFQVLSTGGRRQMEELLASFKSLRSFGGYKSLDRV